MRQPVWGRRHPRPLLLCPVSTKLNRLPGLATRCESLQDRRGRLPHRPPSLQGVTTIKLDGSEVQSPASNGVIRTARSRIDDGKIVTEWKLERRGKLILSGEEVRSLSQDGARQIVDKTVNSRQVIKTHIVMMREQ